VVAAPARKAPAADSRRPRWHVVAGRARWRETAEADRRWLAQLAPCEMAAVAMPTSTAPSNENQQLGLAATYASWPQGFAQRLG